MPSTYSFPAEVDAEQIIGMLRDLGAGFAFVFGSRANPNGPTEAARDDSDVDIGAWWGDDPPDPWTVRLPPTVDLLVLDTAPLFLAGRVAMGGVLLFDDDPPARVHWQADTRKRYLDEQPRRARIDADFAAAVRDG